MPLIDFFKKGKLAKLLLALSAAKPSSFLLDETVHIQGRMLDFFGGPEGSVWPD